KKSESKCRTRVSDPHGHCYVSTNSTATDVRLPVHVAALSKTRMHSFRHILQADPNPVPIRRAGCNSRPLFVGRRSTVSAPCGRDYARTRSSAADSSPGCEGLALRFAGNSETDQGCLGSKRQQAPCVRWPRLARGIFRSRSAFAREPERKIRVHPPESSQKRFSQEARRLPVALGRTGCQVKYVACGSDTPVRPDGNHHRPDVHPSKHSSHALDCVFIFVGSIGKEARLHICCRSDMSVRPTQASP